MSLSLATTERVKKNTFDLFLHFTFDDIYFVTNWIQWSNAWSESHTKHIYHNNFIVSYKQFISLTSKALNTNVIWFCALALIRYFISQSSPQSSHYGQKPFKNLKVK